MDDRESFEKLRQRLQPLEQTHLLAGWHELTPGERQSLAAQIEAIDFELLRAQRQLRLQATSAGASTSPAAVGKSPPAIVAGASDNRFSSQEARLRGEAALRAGQIGMILVAGGQGTRLGFEHPKGMFPIGPLSQRTLFQVIIDRLHAVAARYQTRLPLYVMTSPATTAETKQFFAANDNFGLVDDDLCFFEQGTMPAVDAQSWQVLLEGRGQIASAPDGHGGMLAALAKHVGFERLRKRGITQLFYGQIDNPLLAVCDPEFLGYHLLAGSELTTQVVRKQDPGERVGVVAEVAGHLEVIEYSDMSPGDAARRRADGSLEFWAGSTAVHALDVAFLERMSDYAEALPWHLAHKKVPHLHANGQLVEPQEPNAIKFERFIFDLMPQAKNALVVEVDRAVAFAPVKNASGAASDTAETAQAALIALHASWLTACGAELSPGVKVEIHPRFALDVDELRSKLKPKTRVTEDTYFR